MQVLATVLCLLVVLTAIVVVHEAGHAVAARLCGARVTEFFVGMPWGPEVSRRSGRSGIRYGVTLALLGGYTRIAGMTPLDDPRAPLVLALVNARGRVRVDEVARALGCDDDPDDVRPLLEMLADWGSIREVRPAGARRRGGGPTEVYETVARDPGGLTVLDRGHDLEAPGSTRDGEPYRPPMSADEFFEQERGRTYQGLGLFRRLVVLVAGVVCNVVLAFAIFMLYYMLHGVPAVVSDAVVDVAEGSPAAEAGMVAGDRIVEVDGSPVDGYAELGDALAAVSVPGTVELAYEHDGARVDATVELGEDGMLGVYYPVANRGLGFTEAASASAGYIVEVAGSVASLLVPTQTAEVLGESAGVVGIAVITQDAVAGGIWSVVTLLGMLSLSIGWMNLLPVPPLDGGKVLIELVQAAIRRPVSLEVQGALNLVGMALFALLFFYMVFQDVGRIVGA